jgi:hypothetical protein
MDWLIDYLGFYVPLKNTSLIWRRHHCWWRSAKFRPVLDAQGLWAGRDLYCATPAVTRDLGFSGLIWRTTPFSHLLRHTWGCGGSILTRILSGTRLCGDVIITGLFILFIAAWAIFQLTGVYHHFRWKGCKIEAYARRSGPWADRDLYRASPAVTGGHGVSDLIQRTAPFSHLLWHTRGRR